MKICTKCCVTKASVEYDNNSQTEDGLAHRCKECLQKPKAKTYLDYVKEASTRENYYKKKVNMRL